MKTLFDKTKLQGIDLKNRFVRSATWEGLATWDGHLTDELVNVYEELANGDVGLIITGYAFVNKDEQPAPRMMGIYDDSFIDEYKAFTDKIHSLGSKIALQITYGGSQTDFNINDRVIFGPSSVPEIGSKVVPKEMSVEDIEFIVSEFGRAALRAKQSGFDAVQIQASHGYMLSQFLNPLHNKRSDNYGGSIENRTRIITKVYDEVRRLVGEDYPVLFKINVSDFIDGGMTFEESRFVANRLSEIGADAIELSGGFGAADYPPLRTGINTTEKESYHKEYAMQIASEIDTPVILVGGNKSLDVMDEILSEGSIEYFAMSRPLFREPDLVKRWGTADKSKATCVSCNQCFSANGNRCVFRK